MFFINRKKGLYCKWVRQNDRPGAPLAAVWVDPAVGFFEKKTVQTFAENEEAVVCEEVKERLDSSTCEPRVATPWDWLQSGVRGTKHIEVR